MPGSLGSHLPPIGNRYLTRRRILQFAGIAGVSAGLAACGAGGPDAGSASPTSGVPSPSRPTDLSDTEKLVAFSNWPLYIPVDDAGTFPTNVAFTEATGIAVDYFEDINDNDSFFAKVRSQLESGQHIDRDLVVLTDWMAALWLESGYAAQLDKANMPNVVANLLPQYMGVAFDPNRDFTVPWQSGFSGLVANEELLKEKTGTSELTSVEQLFDPALKGRITVLSEMRDTMAVFLGYLGFDPSNFTEAEFDEAIALLAEQINNGQIRQVSGVDYTGAFETGDAIAGIGWNGIHILGENFQFRLPSTGGSLWTDNFVVPVSATHKKNAELIINHYYDPAIAAQVSAWVQYISPVKGTQAEMEKIDPALAANPNIFPTEEELSSAYVFMTLTPEQSVAYARKFQSAIGL
jgi:spermidine/putrescine transport system substrate-binding protein